MGASSAMYLLARALEDVDSSSDPLKSVAATSSNQNQEMLIENLVFAESKSVRTSTIILASFNVLAAFATAASILYDCYWTSKRCNPKFKASKFCVSWIHPAETFPLVLSIGIVIQGVVFAAVQGEGLKTLFVTGCGTTAQFMWIALFIVPYTQLVFGLECALRSLRKTPFQARGKYDVTLCLVAILLMLIGTWIPTNLNPQRDACFASLVWFVSDFGKLGLILLSIVAGLLLIIAITIFFGLSRSTLVEHNQRIAASRMVYYLVIGFVSLGFVIPNFVGHVVGRGDLKAAMMATVVLNLSGLMNGLLQLFLRSNTATTSFGPKGGSWPINKHEIKIWGPNELGFAGHIIDPVPESKSAGARAGLARTESQRSLIPGPEKDQPIGMSELYSSPVRSPRILNPLRSNAVKPINTASIPATTHKEHSPSAHTRKQSYSLFPPALESPNALQHTQTNRSNLESVYDISDLDDLEPPPALHIGNRGHKRQSSVGSTATVQIGLRISQAPLPKTEGTLPLPSTTYIPKGLPSTIYQPIPLSSAVYPAPTSKFNASLPRERIPVSLAPIQTTNLQKFSPKSPYRSSPLANQATQQFPERSTSPQISPVSASINKTLPAPPMPAAIERMAPIDPSMIQLTPAVYTPPVSLKRKGSTKTTETIESLSPSVYTPPPSRKGSVKGNGSPKIPGPNPSPLGQEPKKQWI